MKAVLFPTLNVEPFLFMKGGGIFRGYAELFLFIHVGLFLLMNVGLFLFINGEPFLFVSEGRGAIRSPIATPTNPAITTSASVTAIIFLFINHQMRR
jgi:hypothetical protein